MRPFAILIYLEVDFMNVLLSRLLVFAFAAFGLFSFICGLLIIGESSAKSSACALIICGLFLIFAAKPLLRYIAQSYQTLQRTTTNAPLILCLGLVGLATLIFSILFLSPLIFICSLVRLISMTAYVKKH